VADTKQDIIELLAREELSAQGLSERLSMTPAGIRQHLVALEGQGLVIHRRLGGEPNRPTSLYRLSEAGKASFPKRYDLLAASMVRTAKGDLGAESTVRLLEHAGREVAAQVAPAGGDRADDALRALACLDPVLAERRDITADSSGALRVLLHHCPFQTVSKEHPEVCPAFFRGLFGALLGARSVSCTPVTQGLACCEIAVGMNGEPAR
jgi:predicted ArsR family transcriptional regulator